MNGQAIAMPAAAERPHEDRVTRVGALFDDHRMPVVNKHERPGRYEGNAILVRLDLFGNADLHKLSCRGKVNVDCVLRTA